MTESCELGVNRFRGFREKAAIEREMAPFSVPVGAKPVNSFCAKPLRELAFYYRPIIGR